MTDQTESVLYECPKCGSKAGAGQGIVVTIPEHAGRYCMHCWTGWIKENIPALIPVKTDGQPR